MKYKFDLLPDEYRSTPRDNIGIFIAIVVIILTIASIGIETMKNKAAFAKIDNQIAEKYDQLKRIVEKTSELQPPISKINELKTSIEFINNNLDTPATEVVAFLTSLESCVPESVIIRDLTPKKLNNLKEKFTVNGEAATIQDILEFVNRLNRSNKFTANLKSNKSGVVAERLIQNFILEFSYKADFRQ